MSSLYRKEYSTLEEILGIDAVTIIEKGPLYRENYFTCKLKLQAPDASRIDIPGYTVILAFPTKTYKPSKVKVAIAGKDLPPFFKEALAKHITDMIGGFGVEETVRKLVEDYDASLLKLWTYFERYQHYEGTTTIIRYQLRSEPPPTKSQDNKDLTLQLSTSPLCSASAAESKPELESTVSLSKKTSIDSVTNSVERRTTPVIVPATDIKDTNYLENTLATSTGDVITWEVSASKALKFRSLSDFRTLGEYYADLYARSAGEIPEELKHAVKNKLAYFAKSSACSKGSEFQVTPHVPSTRSINIVPINSNPSWTEENSITYSQIFEVLLGGETTVKPVDTKVTITNQSGQQISEIRGIYNPVISNGLTVAPRCISTIQLLKLGRYFFENGFTVLSSTSDTVLIQFNFPFSLLSEESIEKLRLNFPSLCKGISEFPDMHLPLIINITLGEKAKAPLVNPDPKHTLLQIIQSIAKRDIAIEYSADKYDYDVLYYLTKGINLLLPMASFITKDPFLENTCPANELEIYEEAIRKQMSDLIAALPGTLSKIPVDDRSTVFTDIYAFFTIFLPDILADLLNASAEKASALKVARALGKIKADGYTPFDEEGTTSSDSSGLGSADDTEDSSEESTESCTGNYDFSGIPASVCENFLLNKDEFAADDSDDSKHDILEELDNEKKQHEKQKKRLNGLRLYIKNLSLTGAILLQLKTPHITTVCSKCLRITVLILTPKEGEGATLIGSASCTGCGHNMQIVAESLIFNNFSGGPHGAEALLVESHTSCLPINLASINKCGIICQCTSCHSTSEHSGWTVIQSGNKVSFVQSFCPICFGKIRMCYSTAIFALQNGMTIHLPKTAAIQQKKQQIQPGPLPNNGSCKHASHSYRWFRFACGLAYPCDTCHSKACACGNSVASMQVCGFCGKDSGVQPTCPYCKKDLTHKRTAHWEGGSGCRDRVSMSRKDNKKHSGSHIKTRSKKAEKRDEMRQRGNAKKKPGDRW
ncbi:Zinc finger protein, putative [Giardia lamblia P15]|uniref:Zinc finger protein, putative n=1 Tax=Giardia intestinalis (strain P15) TaxID=658858 RepID=E1EXC5_GIAIA|nr:Zinc finger protein, putative [Giardia lamblia P15]